MDTLIVPQSEVGALLPMSACIEAIAEALSALARGQAVLPLRTMSWIPDRSGLLATMPGWLGAPAALGVKVITYVPGNRGAARDSHQGAVLLFDTGTGQLLAVIDATSITAIRTAAASGAATRHLARKDAGTLALVGTGTQAGSHLEAMAAVRKLRAVRVCGRTIESARAFAARHRGTAGCAIGAVATAEEAVAGADLVCTVTSSRTPVLKGAWLAPGAHVNAVGACFPDARELDTEAVVRSRVFVDRRESAMAEAGDLLIPMREGAIGEGHLVGELGASLIGEVEGRRSDDEITLYKSLGIAIEDLAAAHVVHARARAEGRGIAVDFGGKRSAS